MTHFAQFEDLRNRSVFITGGGSGIGAALTEAFLRQGAKVAFCQRSDASTFCDAMADAVNGDGQLPYGRTTGMAARSDGT